MSDPFAAITCIAEPFAVWSNCVWTRSIANPTHLLQARVCTRQTHMQLRVDSVHLLQMRVSPTRLFLNFALLTKSSAWKHAYAPNGVNVSDQPAYLSSLIWVFVVRPKKLGIRWAFRYSYVIYTVYLLLHVHYMPILVQSIQLGFIFAWKQVTTILSNTYICILLNFQRIWRELKPFERVTVLLKRIVSS